MCNRESNPEPQSRSNALTTTQLTKLLLVHSTAAESTLTQVAQSPPMPDCFAARLLERGKNRWLLQPACTGVPAVRARTCGARAARQSQLLCELKLSKWLLLRSCALNACGPQAKEPRAKLAAGAVRSTPLSHPLTRAFQVAQSPPMPDCFAARLLGRGK
eukprot:gene22866-biopygen13331